MECCDLSCSLPVVPVESLLTNRGASPNVDRMNVQELRKFTTNGFRPFKLNLSDGRSFSVRHPEFIAFSDLVVVVFGADRLPNLIDPDHIVAAKPVKTKLPK